MNYYDHRRVTVHMDGMSGFYYIPWPRLTFRSYVESKDSRLSRSLIDENVIKNATILSSRPDTYFNGYYLKEEFPWFIPISLSFKCLSMDNSVSILDSIYNHPKECIKRIIVLIRYLYYLYS